MVAPVNPRADWLALRLDPKHVEILSARAIAPSVAKERGVFSVHTKQRLAELGFGRNQQVTPSLVIPSFNALGEIGVYVNRPDQPRYKDGRLLKYEFPASSQAPLDIPVRVRPQLRATCETCS